MNNAIFASRLCNEKSKAVKFHQFSDMISYRVQNIKRVNGIPCCLQKAVECAQAGDFRVQCLYVFQGSPPLVNDESVPVPCV